MGLDVLDKWIKKEWDLFDEKIAKKEQEFDEELRKKFDVCPYSLSVPVEIDIGEAFKGSIDELPPAPERYPCEFIFPHMGFHLTHVEKEDVMWEVRWKDNDIRWSYIQKTIDAV
jgi:hypothetical protein